MSKLDLRYLTYYRLIIAALNNYHTDFQFCATSPLDRCTILWMLPSADSASLIILEVSLSRNVSIAPLYPLTGTP